MVSTYEIKTTKAEHTWVMSNLNPFGTVADLWPDGTFNFEFYDEECEEQGLKALDEMEIRYQLL